MKQNSLEKSQFEKSFIQENFIHRNSNPDLDYLIFGFLIHFTHTLFQIPFFHTQFKHPLTYCIYLQTQCAISNSLVNTKWY